MKLSNLTAKLTCIKSNTAKALATAAVAGTLLTALAPAANAQQVAFGVHFGGPVVYGPRYVAPPVVVYGRPGYVAPYGYYHRDWDDRYYHRGWDDRYHHDWDRHDRDFRRDWR